MFESALALPVSQDFLEKALLLILGAVLTGVLVPVVKARLDAGNAKRRKLLEAELARQTELIESQIKLLREFSELAWKFLFAAFKVCHTHARAASEVQEEAYKEYVPLSWELRTRIRAMVSEATRLGSEGTHDLLKGAHDYLSSLDNQVSEKKNEDASPEEWETFYHKRLGEAGRIVDEAIKSLAKDLDLSSHELA
jgi:uncharacterized membrane-anchored protein YhcB (DUF1043 family)